MCVCVVVVIVAVRNPVFFSYQPKGHVRSGSLNEFYGVVFMILYLWKEKKNFVCGEKKHRVLYFKES